MLHFHIIFQNNRTLLHKHIKKELEILNFVK